MATPTVTSFGITRLRRAELVSFHRRVLGILETTYATSTPLIDALKDAAKRYESLLQIKDFDEQISLEEYDRVADYAWRALKAQITASLMHPDEAVIAAATKVDAIFSKTPDPTNENYDSEYAKLSKLVAQLQTIDEADRHLAAIEPFLTRLESAVSDFYEAANRATHAKAQKNNGEVKSAVKECHEAWRKLTCFLEYRAAIEDDEEAVRSIGVLNAMLNPVKTRLNQRYGKNADKNSPDITFTDDPSADASLTANG